MKRLVLLLIILWCLCSLWGQNYNMSNGTVTISCPQTVHFYDPGGPNGNYGNSLNYTQTFVSSDPSKCLRVTFTSFYLESATWDYLKIYNGTSSSSSLIGIYGGTGSPGVITSTNGALTFVFHSDGTVNYDGWSATITCVDCSETPDQPGGCVPQSTANGSPCATNGIRPFCTEDNDFNVAYPSVTGSHTAAAFLGSSGYACLGSSPRPSWFYMQIENPGNLLIYIEQRASVLPNGQPNPSSSGRDIDFACWGPFEAQSQEDFIEKLCCGYYMLNDIDNDSHRPNNGNHSTPDAGSNPPTWGGYPEGNLIDCSYNYQSTEWCYIPNAQQGQWYLLLVCNYSSSSGYFGFTSQSTSSYGGGQATTNCGLLAPVTSNAPLCEGDTLVLTCTNPQTGATYNWSGPNGWAASTTVPTVSIPNVSASNSGTYNLQLTGVGVTVAPTHIDVVVTAIPQLSLSASVDTICQGSNTTLQVSGAASYTWSPTVPSNRVVSPTTTTTYTVTATTGGCSATASHTIVVRPKPTVSITTNPANAVICKGDTAVLRATGALTYQWAQRVNSTTYTDIATGDSVLVAPQTTTIYRVVATSSEGCTNTATKTVTVRSLPTASISGAEQICLGDSVLLTAGNASQYLWNTGATTRTIWVHPTATGVYQVMVTNSYQCTATAIHFVTVNYPPPSEVLDTTVYTDGFSWHDSVYTSSGTYTHVNNSGNCPSVDTLRLTMAPDLSFRVDTCEYYHWTLNDSVYTVSGTYYHPHGNGSYRVDTLYLVIRDSYETTQTVESCESYTWVDGQTYTESTSTPTQIFIASNLCDSVVHLHLTVYHADHEYLTKDTCSCYDWHGNHYTEGGIYTFSAIDAHGCPYSDTLLLSLHHASPSSMSAQSCDSYEWNGTTYTESGEYTYGHTDDNGCWQVDTLRLTINRPAHGSETVTVCESYEWHGTAYTQSGIFLHALTDEHGCMQVDTLHLTVYHSVPNVERVIVCEPYTWHGTQYDVSGDYYYAYNDQHNCPCTDTLHLKVNSKPELVLTSVLDATCNQHNGQVKIEVSGGTPPYRYVYMPDSITVQLDHLSPGYYHLMVIDSIGCPDDAEFTIDNIIHQVSLVQVVDAHCGMSDGAVEVAAYGGFGQFSYLWDAPIESETNVAEHVRVGQYHVAIADSNGCSLSLYFSVHDIPGPEACFYFSTTNEKHVTLINCTDPDNLLHWSWTFGDGQNSDEWQPLHRYADPGQYPVVLTVVDENNCRDSLLLTYVIREVPTMYLPSAFIPESDIAENRVFKPIGNSISEDRYEMLVYDRWGELVFVSHHPDNGWDGRINGRFAPQGTYAYRIVYRDMEGNPNSVKGNVLLLRGEQIKN